VVRAIEKTKNSQTERSVNFLDGIEKLKFVIRSLRYQLLRHPKTPDMKQARDQ
jgi:hypothetical protein